MNAKKMTLTLSTLLALAQPTHAGDPVARVAGLVGAFALGSMADGGKLSQLDRKISAMQRKIDQIAAEIGHCPAQNGQDQKLSIFARIQAIKEALYGTQVDPTGFKIVGLFQEVGDLKTRMAQQTPGGVATLPAELLQTIEKGIAQSAEQSAHFDQAVNALNTSVAGEIEAVKAQIEALKIEELRAQLSRDLPQFRTDIDALGGRIDAEAAARKELEDALRGDMALVVNRVAALEEAGRRAIPLPKKKSKVAAPAADKLADAGADAGDNK